MAILRDASGNAHSIKNPVPIIDSTHSTRVTNVSAEAVSFVVASTGSPDVGSAAGTVVYAQLTNSNVLDSAHSGLGSKNDSSFSFGTGTVLTTEVLFPFDLYNRYSDDSRANKFAAVGASLAAGSFCIDYRSGLIIGKKATSGTSDTASYSVRLPPPIDVTVTPSGTQTFGGTAHSTIPTPVADGAQVPAFMTLSGKQVVMLNSPPQLVVTQSTNIANTAVEQLILASGAAGVYHDITQLVITNQSSTAVTVTLRDMSAGGTSMAISLAANGGAVIPFNVPLPQTTAANGWYARLSVATVTVDVFVQAIKRS